VVGWLDLYALAAGPWKRKTAGIRRCGDGHGHEQGTEICTRSKWTLKHMICRRVGVTCIISLKYDDIHSPTTKFPCLVASPSFCAFQSSYLSTHTLLLHSLQAKQISKANQSKLSSLCLAMLCYALLCYAMLC